ncbi:MAG TPA: glycosyltransferase family A protein [Phycisphaerae bacterium]|nr:glycosyltransferase family A protein [Phycisphaerae bacterium]
MPSNEAIRHASFCGSDNVTSTVPSPAVSVVIPTYNAPQMLLETLGTVFTQTFTDFEVIVINDGSTDDTSARLASEVSDPRLRVITQENGGIGPARNRGIDEAKGKYIALLDHDDLWMPRKLEVQMAYAQAHPECSIVTVPWAMSTAPEKWTFERELVGAGGIVERPLLQTTRGAMLFCSSSMMFEKARAAGLRYGERRKCIEDQQVHLGLLGRGKLGVAGDAILMIYRWHAANYSSGAEYWYQGVHCLRQLDRSGAFAQLRSKEHGAADLEAFLAYFGRSAMAQQILAGKRLRALGMYARELRHQLSQGRWSFLAALPALAVLPRAVARRALHLGQDGK